MEETIIVTMTKKEVINAIKQETNLNFGSWCNDRNSWTPLDSEGLPMYNYPPLIDDPNCSVCAVGAVLWASGVESYNIPNVADELVGNFPINPIKINKINLPLLVKENPLAALSSVFEGTCHDEGVEEARNRCIALVKEHFPPVIELEYNGKAVYTKGAKFIRGKKHECEYYGW